MIAERHQQAIAACEEQGARLAAVVHHDPDRFEAISGQYGAPCMSLEAMLKRPDIQAVSLCTPSGRHAEQAVAAAAAGKHVLVEKPMATTLDDADRMIRACREAGVQLGIVFQRRAEPLFRRIHKAVQQGDFGDLALGVVTLPYYRGQSYYDSADWRGTWRLDGGGVLMNQGIHLIDLLVWYMGDPVAVRSLGATRFRHIEVEDVMAAALEFENGAVATIAAATAAEPGFPHRLEIYGTGGAVQVEGESVVRWTTTRPDRATVQPFEPSETSGAGAGGDPRGIALTGHIGIFRDFIQAIREQRPPLIDGAEGRRSLSLILSIYQEAGLLPSKSVS